LLFVIQYHLYIVYSWVPLLISQPVWRLVSVSSLTTTQSKVYVVSSLSSCETSSHDHILLVLCCLSTTAWLLLSCELRGCVYIYMELDDWPDCDPSTMKDISWVTLACWSPAPVAVTLLTSTGNACCSSCTCCCCCCCIWVKVCCCCCCWVIIVDVVAVVDLVTVSITTRDSARIEPGTPAPTRQTRNSTATHTHTHTNTHTNRDVLSYRLYLYIQNSTSISSRSARTFVYTGWRIKINIFVLTHSTTLTFRPSPRTF